MRRLIGIIIITFILGHYLKMEKNDYFWLAFGLGLIVYTIKKED